MKTIRHYTKLELEGLVRQALERRSKGYRPVKVVDVKITDDPENGISAAVEIAEETEAEAKTDDA